MDAQTQPGPIDKELLTPIIRRALDSPTAEPVEWSIDRLHHNAIIPSTGGLYRLAGTARDDGTTRPWSLILKVALAPSDPENGDEKDPLYWKREWLAFASGLLDDLPGRIAAPHCYGITDRGGEGGWLWLEEIADIAPGRWPLARFCQAARDLGGLGRAPGIEFSPPAYSWLNTNVVRFFAEAEFLRSYMDPANPQGVWASPLLQSVISTATAERVLGVWAEAEQFAAANERLPQVLGHLDAHRRNLMIRRATDGEEQTVAIDWAFIGTAAIGTELGEFLPGSALNFDIHPFELVDYDSAIYAAYLEGLYEAGWQGDERAVRLGYTSYVALRYGVFQAAWIPFMLDGDRKAAHEQDYQLTAAEIAAGWSALIEYGLDRADEARRLARERAD